MHNIDIYDKAGRHLAGAAPRPTPAPVRKPDWTVRTRSMPASYFFHCDVHPTMMTGTFVVVKGAPRHRRSSGHVASPR